MQTHSDNISSCLSDYKVHITCYICQSTVGTLNRALQFIGWVSDVNKYYPSDSCGRHTRDFVFTRRDGLAIVTCCCGQYCRPI